MLIKLGEAFTISSSDVRPPELVLSNLEIEEKFAKFARELKTIAPKANDFLYFTCVMMTAAEAALLNEDGSLKKDAQGNDIKVHWLENGRSVKWVCSDPNIKPLKNANGDIFPEKELITAYKKWVGKPLCLDHKSTSVDMIRGVIVDTYYDYPRKRIIALCALDKKNYPDLARKVSTGYATCVSMGTGVGRAVCSDCGTCATLESEFCPCMRNKTRYGEINLDLNPIELSLVVQGADPNAKVRRVVAAIDSIAQYVSSKDEEFSSKKSSFSSDQIKSFEQDLNQAMTALASIKEAFTKLNESEDSHQNGEASIDKQASDGVNTLDTLSEKIETISQKISQLLKTNKELPMAEKQAFWLGGGGVNEPTPGKPKYPKEEADSIRDNDDKQMNGQSPFPSTGPVDGMHPGYESFGESEEERKRRLLRLAEEEKRSLRRQAAFEKAKQNLNKAKQAYWLGGGDVNEPTPGKPKYPKEDADSIRDKEDKQMTGQSPFPGVGNVDGLHPSPESAGEKDELKRKEKLRRAGLNAKFTKGAWHVYEADKLVLTASVKDIAGEFSEPLYKSIATKEFGSDLLKRIELDGVEKVVATFKGAQLAPAAPAAPAEAPAAAPSMEASKSEDKGGSGDPSEQIPELLDQLEGLVPDLRKGFDTLTGQSENVPGFEDLGKVAPESFSPAVAAAFVEQKKLYSHLTNGLKNTISKAEFAYNEMKLANDICKPSYKFAAKDAQLQGLVSEAVHNARVAVSDAYRIMDVFVKYHEGTKNVMKKAAKELAFVKKAQTSSGDPLDPMNPDLNVSKPVAPAAPVAPPAPAPTSAPHKLPSEKTMEELMKDRGTLREQTVEDMLRDNVQNGQYAPKNIAPSGPGGLVPQADANQAKDSSSESSMSESSASSASSDSADLKMNPDGSLDGSPEEVGKAMKEMPKKADFDLTTVEGRNAYRAKLAQKAGVKFDPMLDQAHGKGGAVPPSINQNKPSGDLGKVETLEEVKKKMLEAVSGKAKKAAEDIQRLVLAGEIKASEVDGLVSLGVDKDAVSYWKAMWGEAKDKESKEFASELLKEHYEAKVAKEVETYKVKLARSYDLSYEMVRKGAIPNTRTAIAKSVDELSRLDDSGFDTLKKTIEGIPAKEASILPRVGMGEEQVILPKVASHAEADLAAEFNAALNTPRRGFRG